MKNSDKDKQEKNLDKHAENDNKSNPVRKTNLNLDKSEGNDFAQAKAANKLDSKKLEAEKAKETEGKEEKTEKKASAAKETTPEEDTNLVAESSTEKAVEISLEADAKESEKEENSTTETKENTNAKKEEQKAEAKEHKDKKSKDKERAKPKKKAKTSKLAKSKHKTDKDKKKVKYFEIKKSKEKEEPELSPRQKYLARMKSKRKAAGSLLLLSAVFSILIEYFWRKKGASLFSLNSLNLDGALFLRVIFLIFSFLLPSILIYETYKLNSADILGRTKQSKAAYGYSALSAFLIAIAAIGIHNLSLFVLNKLGFAPTLNSFNLSNNEPSVFALILSLLVLVILPSILHEFMFRGLIESSLAASGKLHLSIFLTATAASLFTKNSIFILISLAIYVYLGYVKEKSDNLLIPIMMHFITRLSIFALQKVLPIFTSSIALKGSQAKAQFIASIIFAILAIVLLVPITKQAFNAYDENTSEQEKTKLRRLPGEQWFPVDWKFLLALVILFLI